MWWVTVISWILTVLYVLKDTCIHCSLLILFFSLSLRSLFLFLSFNNPVSHLNSSKEMEFEESRDKDRERDTHSTGAFVSRQQLPEALASTLDHIIGQVSWNLVKVVHFLFIFYHSRFDSLSISALLKFISLLLVILFVSVLEFFYTSAPTFFPTNHKKFLIFTSLAAGHYHTHDVNNGKSINSDWG